MSTRRPRFVQQMSARDCGAACLAMVLGMYGRDVSLAELRRAQGITAGATFASLLQCAQTYGLHGRGVKLDLSQFHLLPTGTILHWEFNHFVVLARQSPQRVRSGRRWIEILDPESGRRRITLDELDRSFTGVALLLQPTEAFQPVRNPPPRRWRQLVALARQERSIGHVLGLTVLVQMVALAVPVFTGLLVDTVVPSRAQDLLLVLLAGAAALIGFHALAMLVRGLLLAHLSTRLDARLSLRFVKHLVRLPGAFFLQSSVGDLALRINSNLIVRENLSVAAVTLVIDGLFAAGYLLVALLISPAMTLLALGLAALQVLLFVVTRPHQQRVMTQTLHTQARLQSFQTELLSGMDTVKAMGCEDLMVRRWSSLFGSVLEAGLARGRLLAVVDALSGSLSLAAPILLLGWGTLLVLEGAFSLGTLLVLNGVLMGFLQPLANLVITAYQLVSMESYLERIDDVMATATEERPSGARLLPQLRGAIELCQVTFRYSLDGSPAVYRVSLRIEPGQLVAIVGRSGSGKSTLASLLAGLYQPTEGNIRFDGHDLETVPLGWLRAQLGVVRQNTHLFAATIRDNIALGGSQLTDEHIVQAAKLAGIHEHIATLPMGYDEPLLDGGASLSGGQRQRIALARALVRQPAVLLLDEATSALDAPTEADIHARLAALRCTRIVIAHRLSTIQDADLIVVMDRGQVVDTGTHEQLVARGGLYTELTRRVPDRLLGDAGAGAATQHTPQRASANSDQEIRYDANA